jgi:hypothetical protein
MIRLTTGVKPIRNRLSDSEVTPVALSDWIISKSRYLSAVKLSDRCLDPIWLENDRGIVIPRGVIDAQCPFLWFLCRL